MGVIAVVAIGLVASGCGGSKHAASTAAAKPALSKAQFVAEGNAVCTNGNQKLAATQRALEKTVGNHAPTQAQLTAYVDGVFAPLIQTQIDQLKALGAPAGEQATITNVLDVAQADLNKVKSNPTALTERSFASFARLAHPYGLTACARRD
jgi:hypothetical protein